MIKKIFILLIILFIPIKAFALIEVDITRGNLNPLPLAVSPLSIDEKSKKEVEEQLSAMNGKSLSMREALKKVWSGQEGKNPFEDENKKKMKEKKDFAKGSKAATGEPAAKVEIDPKIKD